MLKLLILATDPFMRLLVEREASEEVNLDKLEDIPIVWRYKSPITLDHLKKTLEDHAQHSDFKILRMFLKEVYMEIFVQSWSKGITYFLLKYHIYKTWYYFILRKYYVYINRVGFHVLFVWVRKISSLAYVIMKRLYRSKGEHSIKCRLYSFVTLKHLRL